MRLSFAADNGRLEVVKFPVWEGGADVDSKDNWGKMALDLAREGTEDSKVCRPNYPSLLM